MVVKSLLGGFALLSIAEKALATYSPGTDSVATCDLTAVTQSSSLSVSVAAEAVDHVNAFLCGENENLPEESSAYALAMADSFVNAVVETTASCYAEGYASYKINGGSVAYAQATAIAKAFAEATAVAETCHKCLAATSLVALSYEEIFLKATSEIDTTMQGLANGDSAAETITATAKSFIEITVVALAEVLVAAHAEVDKCASTIEATIKTGDTTDSNSVTCQLNSSAADDEVVRNACVAVSTSVAAHVCGDGVAQANFEIEAQAIGSAMAIAITEVTLDCQVEGKGTVCAMAKADMIKTAEAVAYIFAFGYVSATSSCNNVCHSDISVLTEAIGSVLATATSDSLEKQCTGPDSYFDIAYIEKQIVEASITALASILTSATATSEGDCVISLDIEAAVAPEEEHLVSGPALNPVHPYQTKPTTTVYPEPTTEVYPEPTTKPDHQPDYKPEHQPEHHPEHHQPDYKLEHQPEHHPEHHQPDHKPEHQPEHHPEHHHQHPGHHSDHSEKKVDYKPEHHSDHQPDYKPEHQPEHHSEHQHQQHPGHHSDHSEKKVDHKPEHHSDYQPQHEPDHPHPPHTAEISKSKSPEHSHPTQPHRPAATPHPKKGRVVKPDRQIHPRRTAAKKMSAKQPAKQRQHQKNSFRRKVVRKTAHLQRRRSSRPPVRQSSRHRSPSRSPRRSSRRPSQHDRSPRRSSRRDRSPRRSSRRDRSPRRSSRRDRSPRRARRRHSNRRGIKPAKTAPHAQRSMSDSRKKKIARYARRTRDALVARAAARERRRRDIQARRKAQRDA